MVRPRLGRATFARRRRDDAWEGGKRMDVDASGRIQSPRATFESSTPILFNLQHPQRTPRSAIQGNDAVVLF
jgi:hypothetical protein